MSEQDPKDLIKLLRSGELRCRTGILLLPDKWLGREPDVAARLDIDCLDYAQTLQEAFSYGTAYVDIDVSSELDRLDTLASNLTVSDCLLIYNIDLALSKLYIEGSTSALWNGIWEKLSNRSVSLVIAVPEGAKRLLPDSESLEHWVASGRIARYVSADN